MTNLHAVAKKYDPGTFDALWVSAKAQGGITLGTLFHHAQAAGWDSSNPSDDVTDSDQDVPPWVLELNKYFAWVEEQAEIYRIEFDDFIKPHAFRTQLNNEIVEKQTAKGSQWVGKGTQWLKEKGRRQHKGLVLRPKEGRVTADNCLNVWRGFAVERTPGTVKPFINLLVRLAPDSDASRFIIKWLAHLVQHPDVKMHTSLVFWSIEQGVGKNLMAECIRDIFCTAHAILITQSELDSDFNGWANGKIFVIGDEVSSSDKRQDHNKLKGLITSTTLHINEKHQPRREVSNLLNFIFLSNSNDAMFVADHDRRYFVWEIESPRLSDNEIKAFVDWRDHGGLGHLLDFLLRLDLKGFDPKAPAPETAAKLEMIEDNRSDLEAWAADLMGSDLNKVLGRELATSAELAQLYRHERDQRNTSTKAVVSAFKRLGAHARPGQVRLSTGKKVRALVLANVDYWKDRTESEWAAELMKPRPLAVSR